MFMRKPRPRITRIVCGFLIALVAVSENKKDEAINAFETALKVDATNYDALNGLITLYSRNNEADKAHARIDQALASFPNMASLHFLKASAYGFQHNATSAEAELRKALELDSNYVAAYYALAAIYVNTRQEDRAIAEYQKFIALRPDNSAAPYTLIGIIEDMRKNFDAAEQNYRKALEKDPNAIIAANNLAWLYTVTGKGNPDEAVRLAQGVLQKSPNSAGFIDTLGWIYYKKNLPALAVAPFQESLKKRPDTPEVLYHLGLAYAKMGDNSKAREALERALKLDPNFSGHNFARETLVSVARNQ